MLTLPSVHPFLMPLIIEGRLDEEQLTALPHHSWETIIEEAIAQRVAAVLFHRLNESSHQHRLEPAPDERAHSHPGGMPTTRHRLHSNPGPGLGGTIIRRLFNPPDGRS